MLHHRQAFGLLEVVASLAILGSVISLLLVSRADHVRQWRTANQQIEAVQLADQLLAHWTQGDAGIPRNASGLVSDILTDTAAGLGANQAATRWQTVVIPNATADEVGCEVIRVELWVPVNQNANVESVAFVDAAAQSIPTFSSPTVSLELLVQQQPDSIDAPTSSDTEVKP